MGCTGTWKFFSVVTGDRQAISSKQLMYDEGGMHVLMSLWIIKFYRPQHGQCV